jgi:serine/threonine-protein kinase HipA
MKNKLLEVFYHERLVGKLAETKTGLLAFEYASDWLAAGFSISPFKLPLEKKVFVASREPFAGNFGVFDDSLPDGWGRLLVDLLLRQRQIDPARVSVLERLAMVGSSGMGALEYRPATPLVVGEKQFEIATLAREVEAILQERAEGKLEDLVQVGGSSGGARPKALIKIDVDDWLIKFRSSSDPEDIGQQEFAYLQAAGAAGLVVPESRLFEDKYFGVKRFDRQAGEKIMMISASGLLHASHRFPSLDYNDLLKAALKLTQDYREVEKMWRLMCFNVLAHNRDDHSKNFSFLYHDGRWQVAPAYDLVYAAGMNGEHATAIDGEGREPGTEKMLAVARKAGLKQQRVKQIMKEVEAAVAKAKLGV